MYDIPVDETYSESDLLCLTSQGKLLVFSVPHLRRQLCTDSVVSADVTRLLRVMWLLNYIHSIASIAGQPGFTIH